MECPCHSGLSYPECCEPYHLGKQLPESALQLMRSRYSAYAIKNADYIIATTHPENSSFSADHKDWKESILYFCNRTSFRGLKVIEVLEGLQESYVTFFAHLFQNGDDVSFQETSRFVKVGDRWLYHSKIPEHL
jgi:SEC-C motif-containing protein